MMGSLASLDIGEAWVWEPGAEPPLFQRVRIRQRRTFNSSATPKHGEERVEPKRLAAVDLAALQTRMAATIEKAKADDPRELRRQIAELKKQAADFTQAAAVKVPTTPAKSVEVLTDADRDLLRDLAARMTARADAIADRADVILQSIADRAKDAIAATITEWMGLVAAQRSEFDRQLDLKGFQKILGKLSQLQAPSPPSSVPTLKPRRDWPKPEDVAPRRSFDPPRSRPQPPASGNGSVTGAEKRILNALAELEALGVKEPERVQVAFFAGYTHLNSKGLVNALGALRSSGLIDYPMQGRVLMTDAGQAHAEAVDVPRTPDELRERVVRMLGGASARILAPLIKAYPTPMAREDLAAAASYGHLNSKGFVNALGRLRSLGFIDYPAQGQVAAQPVLFLE
jgi:uncharacterized protein